MLLRADGIKQLRSLCFEKPVEGLFGTSEFVYGSDLGLPLWYAHYDNDPSFDDYPKYSFGGGISSGQSNTWRRLGVRLQCRPELRSVRLRAASDDVR